MTESVLVTSFRVPSGTLLLGSLGSELVLCDWAGGWHRGTTDARMKRLLRLPFREGSSPVIESARSQLGEYFDGSRRQFDLPIRLVGSDFQQTVWRALLGIPYGGHETYAGLARRIGRPSACRAVANAVGANPMSVIVPCHRVLGLGGKLTGYGGGLPAKMHLLRLEGIPFDEESADE
ncbi:MAG: methylated-DNA--[protein]-cysteine S-methyltransferase [Sutterella sp.]|nr:methylated-DNA--[protein]-cysteine S-methyltransferase [Sutterella sp.]